MSEVAPQIGAGEPAPRVRRSAPSATPPHRAAPAGVPGRRPAPHAPSPRVRGHAVVRTKGTVGFLVLSTVVVGSMILGLVTLNALIAQSSFRVDDLEQRVSALKLDNLELTHKQATLSAPGRIAAWARRHGMRLPDEIQFLHVPKARPTAPAGTADELATIERKLERVLGEDG
jgi:cell division protein FtsL